MSKRLFDVFGLRRLIDELAEVDENAVLTADQHLTLHTQAGQLRDTALAEAHGLYAYVTSDKRLAVDKLLDDPAALFPTGVFAQLSDMAKTDVAEGFKCIGFERPTAAACHLMRAVEEMLRCFYRAMVKQKRVKPLLWKAMTDHLAQRRTPPSPALMAQLDHIRLNFRNPTQHPDATYDLDEAQDLAFLTLDVLTRLVRAMPS